MIEVRTICSLGVELSMIDPFFQDADIQEGEDLKPLAWYYEDCE
jgi:hypothetical protein